MRAVLSAVCVAAVFTSASAQVDPDDPGTGIKLGVTQLDNSGQVGTVSLYERGARKTLVVLALYSAPVRGLEAARIRPGHTCGRVPAGSSGGLALAAVARGLSRTDVALPLRTLLSGNYLVEAFAPARAPRRVACGLLYGRVPHKEDGRPR